MKFCFRSTTILLLACSVVTIPLHARELGRCLGTFEIGKESPAANPGEPPEGLGGHSKNPAAKRPSGFSPCRSYILALGARPCRWRLSNIIV